MNNPNIQPTNQQNPQLPPQYIPQAYAAPMHDADEINLLEYVYVLVKAKWWILGAAVLGLIIGSIAAYVKGPRYVAEAVIAPKETESQKTPNLSALGALSGLAAAQFGLGGNASLDKIETIIGSREFNASFVDYYNYLPEIYRTQWPKAYDKMWDSRQNAWKSDFVPPKRLDMGNFLKASFIKTTTNKNNTMTVTISSIDSTFADTLLTRYIKFLNDYIKSQVQRDANDNVDYLNRQLDKVADPLLREKFLSLIASEVEKAMMVSKQAFKIVDPPYRTRQFKEKKLYPMVFAVGLGFACMLIFVLGHAVSSGDKTEEDKKLITRIKQETFRFPLSK